MTTTRPERYAILGATSRMAEEIARNLAGAGAELLLVGRRAEALEAMAADQRVRGAAGVEIRVANFDDPEACDAAVAAIRAWQPAPTGILLAWGTLDRTLPGTLAPAAVAAEIHANFTSQAGVLAALSQAFDPATPIHLTVIGSVAGDRGRAGNYPYGGPKAGLEAWFEGYCAGHRGRFRGLLVKPGPTRTPMTEAFDPPPALMAEVEDVGRAVANAMRSGRQGVMYVPGRWRWIMLILRCLPRAIFSRLPI